jgi:hypothetical protein
MTTRIPAGQALIRKADNSVVLTYGGEGPFNVVYINVAGDQEGRWVFPGWECETHRLVPRYTEDAGAPSPWHSRLADTVVFDGEQVVSTANYSAAEDIVPQTITKLRLKLILQPMGLWDQLKAMLAGNADAKETWDLALDVNRAHPLVEVFRQTAQMTAEQVDDIFREGQPT